VKTLVQTLRLENRLAELPRLASFVDQFCTDAAVARKDRAALQVVLEEAAINVIAYGYGPNQTHAFTVNLERTDQTVVAIITDNAFAYDPLARPEVDVSRPLEQRAVGGLGVHMIKHLTEARYERRGEQNVLTLVRRLGAPS